MQFDLATDKSLELLSAIKSSVDELSAQAQDGFAGIKAEIAKTQAIPNIAQGAGMNELLSNLDKLHTTELGVGRIRKNLGLETDDVVAWCRQEIKKAKNIIRKGKNWYAHTGNTVITVNAHSYTIITAKPAIDAP